ncbi:MAG: SHOCT domain-containing protein [Chitinophagales bacterium]
MEKIKLKGNTYSLSTTTGYVLDNIKSKKFGDYNAVTIIDDLQLIDQHNKRYSFKLTGWDLSCALNDIISVVEGIDKNNNTYYLALKNHSTGKEIYSTAVSGIFGKTGCGYLSLFLLFLTFLLTQGMVGEDSGLEAEKYKIYAILIWLGVISLCLAGYLKIVNDEKKIKSSMNQLSQYVDNHWKKVYHEFTDISKFISNQAPAQNNTDHNINELERLIKLKEAGHISDEEYNVLKKKLLDQ